MTDVRSSSDPAGAPLESLIEQKIEKLRKWRDDWREHERFRAACDIAVEDLKEILTAEIERLRGAVPPATPPQWRPIDTAPKDGNAFIGLDVQGEVGKVHWSERYNPHGWVATDELLVYVTHWMPLPGSAVPTSDPICTCWIGGHDRADTCIRCAVHGDTPRAATPSTSDLTDEALLALATIAGYTAHAGHTKAELLAAMRAFLAGNVWQIIRRDAV